MHCRGFEVENRRACGLGSSALASILAGVVILPAHADPAAGQRANPEASNWTAVGRTSAESYYSPLKSVNTVSVKELGLAWYVDLRGQRGSLQATPLVVDGVLYFSGSDGWVFAVDAAKGTLLWSFDPDLSHHAPNTNGLMFGANRGVSYSSGKVYVGTVDGRLAALDATTGRVQWSVQTFDKSEAPRSITGAPRVFNGKVIIGNTGDAGSRGYVTAYDAESGALVWRFYTVPGDPAKGFENAAMAMAAKTWTGRWWEHGGNGSVWDAIVYDSDYNRIYIGTANGVPWDSHARSPEGGDNLFVSSIVALDADTGRYVWHYQQTPGESWDYDATSPIILTDLVIRGRPTKALLQASKNGFFYVLDRSTGKLVAAYEYAKVTWAKRIDLATGRPVESRGIRDDKNHAAIWPSYAGAHSWQPVSYNPGTGLAYIPALNLGNQVAGSRQDANNAAGLLVALNPTTGEKRWQRHYDSLWNGGTMTTAGNLVFQGTGRGNLMAFDARNGQELWSYYAGLGINAAPMTYELNGTQYICVLVGYGGAANLVSKLADYGWRFGEQPRRLLTFALNGKTPLPAALPPRFTVKAVDDPKFVIDEARAERGEMRYWDLHCVNCHGADLASFASSAPDLRESAAAMNWASFEAIVQQGALAQEGMPKFAALTEGDLRDLYMYIRRGSRAATLVAGPVASSARLIDSDSGAGTRIADRK